MKDVKVLGPGCKRCETTEQMVRSEAAKLGVEVNVEKITDFAEIGIRLFDARHRDRRQVVHEADCRRKTWRNGCRVDRSAGERLGLGLMPNPSDPRPAGRRWAAPRSRPHASSIRRIDPRAKPVNRPFLAGAIRRRGDG